MTPKDPGAYGIMLPHSASMVGLWNQSDPAFTRLPEDVFENSMRRNPVATETTECWPET